MQHHHPQFALCPLHVATETLSSVVVNTFAPMRLFYLFVSLIHSSCSLYYSVVIVVFIPQLQIVDYIFPQPGWTYLLFLYHPVHIHMLFLIYFSAWLCNMRGQWWTMMNDIECYVSLTIYCRCIKRHRYYASNCHLCELILCVRNSKGSHRSMN